MTLGIRVGRQIRQCMQRAQHLHRQRLLVHLALAGQWMVVGVAQQQLNSKANMNIFVVKNEKQRQCSVSVTGVKTTTTLLQREKCNIEMSWVTLALERTQNSAGKGSQHQTAGHKYLHNFDPEFYREIIAILYLVITKRRMKTTRKQNHIAFLLFIYLYSIQAVLYNPLVLTVKRKFEHCKTGLPEKQNTCEHKYNRNCQQYWIGINKARIQQFRTSNTNQTLAWNSMKTETIQIYLISEVVVPPFIQLTDVAGIPQFR